MQPSVAQCCGGLIRSIPVAEHRCRPSRHEFACLPGRQRRTGFGMYRSVFRECVCFLNSRRTRDLRAAYRVGCQFQRVLWPSHGHRSAALGHSVTGDDLADTEVIRDLLPQPDRSGRRTAQHRGERAQVVAVARSMFDHRHRHRRHAQDVGGAMPLNAGEVAVGAEGCLGNHRPADETDRQQALDVAEHVITRQREQNSPTIFIGPGQR